LQNGIGPAASERSRTPLRDRAGSVALLLVTLVLIAASLETAVRIERGKLFSAEKARKGQLRLIERPIAVHDAQLGHIPAPNVPGRRFGGSQARVTTDAEGVRMNRSRPRPDGVPILAVGDSFTFGLEVDDEETWPAHLERLVRRPVLNGGVFGYGLDQIALRAERLLATHPGVRVLIVGVFGDDIERCEYSYLFAPKPWFDVVDGALVLRNARVPDPSEAAPFVRLRGWLEYSHAADLVFSRVAPAWWLVEGAAKREHDRGDRVAALLLDRIAAQAASRRLRIVLVTLLPQDFDPGRQPALDALATHAREVGMEVVDLAPALVAMALSDRERWLTPGYHFSPEANAWVAARIAEHLR